MRLAGRGDYHYAGPTYSKVRANQCSTTAWRILQATTEGENSLLHNVKSIVEKARSVIDFLSGCGTFSLPLAETKRSTLLKAKTMLKQWMPLGVRQRIEKMTHEAGDLYRRPLLPDELDQLDAAVIDPHARALRHKFMNWREVGLGR